MSLQGNEYLKNVSAEITRRLVEGAVRQQFMRNNLELVTDADDDEPALNEENMVQDALNLALGDDTGCLSVEELTPERVDVLFVERKLAEIERSMRDRCFHDLLRHLESSVRDQHSSEGRDAVLLVAAGIAANGPDGFGVARQCKCNEPECPHQQLTALGAVLVEQ